MLFDHEEVEPNLLQLAPSQTVGAVIAPEKEPEVINAAVVGL